MSDMLSHWAIFEDARKIAAQDASFDPLLTGVIARHLEYARLGTVTRGGNKWMRPIIERAKAQWNDPAAHPALDRKLAFAFGGLPHQAIDKVIKPYRSEVVEREEDHPEPLVDVHRWLYAYQDAYLFRRVFDAGKGEDPFFNPLLLARNDSLPGQAIEAYARSMVLRGLQGLHTLAPNTEDMDGWLDRMTDFIQPVTVDIERLVEAFVDPDPAKLERFRIEEEFYREADPAIQLAERARSDKRLSQHEIEEAIHSEDNESIYGTSIAVAVRYMREGAKFWRGETDRIDTPNYDTSAFWAKQAARGRMRKQEVTSD